MQQDTRPRRRGRRDFNDKEQMKKMAQKKQQNLRSMGGGLYESAGTGGSMATKSLRLSQPYDNKALLSSQKSGGLSGSQQIEFKTFSKPR